MNDIKKLFPIFEKQPDLHYLDSAATALKPKVVLDKMLEYYTEYSANIHRGLYPMSERSTEEYEKVREIVKNFIGAKDESEIVFTSGTTDSLNLVARGWMENNLNPEDEIVIGEIEHHSNLVPWQQLAKKMGTKLKFIDVIAPVRSGGRNEATKQSRSGSPLSFDSLAMTLSSKTKLLAITHVSNVLGEINQIKEIIEAARKISPDICVVVDGAQAVPHIPVNVVDMDVDFYAFSGHKLYGPTGVGVLYGKAKRWLETNPAKFGGGMIRTVELQDSTWANGPEKFEAGTPPIAEVIGLGTAIKFVEEIGWEKINKVERELTSYLLKSLKQFNWLEVAGNNELENKVGVVAVFPTDKRMGTSHDIADILGREFNVCVRAGHHCTMPLHHKMRMETGTVRISLGMYNTTEDIDELIKGLKKVEEIFLK